MTCQHCQTWVLDEDHRCQRCGRRVRNTRRRISPQTFPVAATANAPAYDFEIDPVLEDPEDAELEGEPVSEEAQKPLFPPAAADARVIPFDALTTEAARQSIRVRVAEFSRPAPREVEKVQLPRVRSRKKPSSDQQDLDFFGGGEVRRPESNIICDAPVAPATLRLQAAAIDGALIAAGVLLAAAAIRLGLNFIGGQISFDKHSLCFLALAISTVPLFYKTLWTIAGLDTIGMRLAGLKLVDFDGNSPSHARRYHRLIGSAISLLAGGIGLIWIFLDPDSLTWHDHMSDTFPAIIGDK